MCQEVEKQQLLSEQQTCSFHLVYVYVILMLIFGFYFYEFISFNPMDEMFEVLLIGLAGVYLYENRFLRPQKDLLIWAGVALFYLLYSFFIHSNIPKAILIDFSVQIKPYVAFFVFYYLGVVFSDKKKKILQCLIFALFGLSLIVTFYGLLSGDFIRAVRFLYFHPTHYATAIVLLSMFYLYSTKLDLKNILIMFFILSFSVLSGRSKIYGFYVATFFVVSMIFFNVKLKLNIKAIVFICLMLVAVLFVAKDKIIFYFVDYDSAEEESLARPLLYLVSMDVFKDFIPFGSGLASYATAASGEFYSDLYYRYNLNGIWGLSPDYYSFVSDTYYPSLAQFGIVGVTLFILFWRRIIKEALFYEKRIHDKKHYMIILLLCIFLGIEMIAGSILTYNRGFVAMMLIALCLNEMKQKYREIKKDSDDEEAYWSKKSAIKIE